MSDLETFETIIRTALLRRSKSVGVEINNTYPEKVDIDREALIVKHHYRVKHSHHMSVFYTVAEHRQLHILITRIFGSVGKPRTYAKVP